MLTKHDFQIFTKKSLKRRNEPQQFIVNKLLTRELNKRSRDHKEQLIFREGQ